MVAVLVLPNLFKPYGNDAKYIFCYCFYYYHRGGCFHFLGEIGLVGKLWRISVKNLNLQISGLQRLASLAGSGKTLKDLTKGSCLKDLINGDYVL